MNYGLTTSFVILRNCSSQPTVAIRSSPSRNRFLPNQCKYAILNVSSTENLRKPHPKNFKPDKLTKFVQDFCWICTYFVHSYVWKFLKWGVVPQAELQGRNFFQKVSPHRTHVKTTEPPQSLLENGGSWHYQMFSPMPKSLYRLRTCVRALFFV